jgi:hypothetical protein
LLPAAAARAGAIDRSIDDRRHVDRATLEVPASGWVATEVDVVNLFDEVLEELFAIGRASNTS